MHKVGNEFLTCFAAVVTSVPFPRILTLTVREQILHRSPPVGRSCSLVLYRHLSHFDRVSYELPWQQHPAGEAMCVVVVVVRCNGCAV